MSSSDGGVPYGNHWHANSMIAVSNLSTNGLPSLANSGLPSYRSLSVRCEPGGKCLSRDIGTTASVRAPVVRTVETIGHVRLTAVRSITNIELLCPASQQWLSRCADLIGICERPWTTSADPRQCSAVTITGEVSRRTDRTRSAAATRSNGVARVCRVRPTPS